MSLDKKLTQEKFDEYFKLLYKYPMNIEIFNKTGDWNQFKSNMFPLVDEIDIEPMTEDEVSKFIEEQYDLFVKIEVEINELEFKKDYEYPPFLFDYEKIKDYCYNELFKTSNKIIYLNYILKEYPQHLMTRMNVYGQHMNGVISQVGYYDRTASFMKAIDSQLGDHGFIFPPIPQRFEDQIAGELKYQHIQLSMEHLSTNDGKNKAPNKHLKEIKKLKRMLDQKDEKDLLTLNEAAEYMKISRATLYRYVKQGLLHHKMIGNKKYVSRKEIDSKISEVTGKIQKR